MSLASGSCQSWLQWGRNLAEFDSGLPCFKFCFQRHAPIVRGLVSPSHIHRFDSPLPPVFCGSSAAFALAAPRVQLEGVCQRAPAFKMYLICRFLDEVLGLFWFPAYHLLFHSHL